METDIEDQGSERYLAFMLRKGNIEALLNITRSKFFFNLFLLWL